MCSKIDKPLGLPLVKVNEYIDNKTFHPGCPLDSEESHVNIYTATAYDSGHEAGMQDATKHIREVWKEHEKGVPFMQSTVKLWLEKFEKAIKADLNDKEGEG